MYINYIYYIVCAIWFLCFDIQIRSNLENETDLNYVRWNLMWVGET